MTPTAVVVININDTATHSTLHLSVDLSEKGLPKLNKKMKSSLTNKYSIWSCCWLMKEI